VSLGAVRIADPVFLRTLARGGRRERALEMAEGLAKVGIHDTFDGALQYVGNPELISRTHFARHLVDTGICDDTQDVFRRFLVEGKPGFAIRVGGGLSSTPRLARDLGVFVETGETVEVLRGLRSLHSLGRPVLLAVSRKDFVGAITGRPPRGRLAGTLAAVGDVVAGSAILPHSERG